MYINLCECGCGKPLIYSEHLNTSVFLRGKWYLKEHATGVVISILSEGDAINKKIDALRRDIDLENSKLRAIKKELCSQGFMELDGRLKNAV